MKEAWKIQGQEDISTWPVKGHSAKTSGEWVLWSQRIPGDKDERDEGFSKDASEWLKHTAHREGLCHASASLSFSGTLWLTNLISAPRHPWTWGLTGSRADNDCCAISNSGFENLLYLLSYLPAPFNKKIDVCMYVCMSACMYQGTYHVTMGFA